MKLAYFGGDVFFSCFESILNKGFEITKVYINEPIDSAVKISHYCEKLGIELVSTRPCYEAVSYTHLTLPTIFRV